jgi:hypothetical protein
MKLHNEELHNLTPPPVTIRPNWPGKMRLCWKGGRVQVLRGFWTLCNVLNSV